MASDDLHDEYPDVTDGRKRSFLLTLEICGTATKAAMAAGIARSTAFQWRRDDPAFARAYDQAREVFNDSLLDEMHRRAVLGVDKPITFKGEITGHERVYSDELLIRLAAARMPALFDRRAHIPPTTDTRPLQIAPADAERIVAKMDEYLRGKAALPASMLDPTLSSDAAQWLPAFPPATASDVPARARDAAEAAPDDAR